MNFIFRSSFKSAICFAGFWLSALSLFAQLGNLEYELLRHYDTANKDQIQYYYLETKERQNKEGLEKIADKFYEDSGKVFDLLYIFFRHADQTYAEIRYNPRLEAFIDGNEKVTFYLFLKPGENIADQIGEYEYCDLNDPQIIAGWSRDLSSKRISYCLKDLGEGRFFFVRHSQGTVNKDLDRDYYKHFERYGDSSQESFYFFWSKPQKDTPYHTIYFINDFGDLVIKDERDDFVLSVTRRTF